MMVIVRLRVVDAQRIEVARNGVVDLYNYLSCGTGVAGCGRGGRLYCMPKALEDTFL